VIDRFRTEARFFTRRRKLMFEDLVVLILYAHRRPMQNALNFLYRQLDRLGDLVTASAYSQARRKIKPELFSYLRQEMLTIFYQPADPAEPIDPTEPPIATWCGRRLVGGDVTMLNLPETARLRREFTVQPTARSEQGVIQAAGLVCFDVLNDVVLGGHLLKRQSVRQMLVEHALEDLQPTDVLVLDREFGDTGLMAYLCHTQQDFIIRVQTRHFVREVATFVASGDLEAIVTVGVAPKQKEFARGHGLAPTMRLRLIRYDLPGGEVEVLVTSLLDTTLYSRAKIIEAYGLRWNIETYFDRLKNLFEVERFSSTTPQAIAQDFQGMLFLSTLESILTREATQALDRRSQDRRCVYRQKVNRSVSYAVVLETVIELLCDTAKSIETVLGEISQLLMTNPTLIRPGRSNKRTPLPQSQRPRYLRYRRRLT
jgi:hypothetical protein